MVAGDLIKLFEKIPTQESRQDKRKQPTARKNLKTKTQAGNSYKNCYQDQTLDSISKYRV